MNRAQLALLAMIAAIAAIAWWNLERVDALLAGGNPLASPIAAERVDQIYEESPLAVALRLEQEHVDIDATAALAFADDVARELGWWVLAQTGASDLTAAEPILWNDIGPDAFATRWAVALREREVHARRARHLADGHTLPVYVHPDELVLLFAHVAWRLDLDTVLVRSPVHHYVLWNAPGEAGGRGIEPTNFRRVDALGRKVPFDGPTVGRSLFFSPDYFISGVGGIRNPDPLPPGAYEPVSNEELSGDLLAALAGRRPVPTATLEAFSGENVAVIEGLWAGYVREGIEAWKVQDQAALQGAWDKVHALRRDHGALLPEAPDELAVEAALRGRVGGLAPLFAFYEPDGPVLAPGSDAHAMAMWLDLEAGAVSHDDWNRRIIPLMNRHKDDPEQFRRLCDFGQTALKGVEETLLQLMPDCQDL